MATPLLVIAGLCGLAGIAKYGSRIVRNLPKSAVPTGGRLYRGGFEQKMSKREAGLVLGVKETDPKDKIKANHRRVMLANHPDKGGSPYLAAKVNEAKQILDQQSARKY